MDRTGRKQSVKVDVTLTAKSGGVKKGLLLNSKLEGSEKAKTIGNLDPVTMRTPKVLGGLD